MIESTDGHEPRRIGQRVGVYDPHSLPLLPVAAGWYRDDQAVFTFTWPELGWFINAVQLTASKSLP